jgi:hypothetical protein
VLGAMLCEALNLFDDLLASPVEVLFKCVQIAHVILIHGILNAT